MKLFTRLAFLAALALGAAALFIPGPSVEAAPAEKTTKVATLTCPNGWKGSGGGTYGGVSFSLACAYDRDSVTLEGVQGTEYGFRMGTQSFGGSVDCFFSGDEPRVSESCGDVKFTVR
jgi:hypothetical protein